MHINIQLITLCLIKLIILSQKMFVSELNITHKDYENEIEVAVT